MSAHTSQPPPDAHYLDQGEAEAIADAVAPVGCLVIGAMLIATVWHGIRNPKP